MTHEINGIKVYEGMLVRAKAAGKNGGKVFITVAGDADKNSKGKTHCANCNGYGKLALEVFIGGPYMDPTGHKHVVWHDGGYYERDLEMFCCPECRGAGIFSRATARWDELQL